MRCGEETHPGPRWRPKYVDELTASSEFMNSCQMTRAMGYDIREFVLSSDSSLELLTFSKILRNVDRIVWENSLELCKGRDLKETWVKIQKMGTMGAVNGTCEFSLTHSFLTGVGPSMMWPTTPSRPQSQPADQALLNGCLCSLLADQQRWFPGATPGAPLAP